MCRFTLTLHPPLESHQLFFMLHLRHLKFGDFFGGHIGLQLHTGLAFDPSLSLRHNSVSNET